MAKKRGPAKQKHIPLRTCVACRETKPKHDLIRIVMLADGTVVIDKRGKLNGRGAYLCRRHACWRRALERGLLSRALRAAPPPEAKDELEAYAEALSPSTEA